MKNNQENTDYSRILKMLKKDDKSFSREILFDLIQEYSKPKFENLWDNESEIKSYWIILINGINNQLEVKIIKEFLFWKEFFGRSTTHIRCLQSSDSQYFGLCIKKFNIKTLPTLIMSNNKNFNDFISIDKPQLIKFLKRGNDLSQFLNQIQFKIINEESLIDIENLISKEDFYNHLGKINALKRLVSENKLLEVINILKESEKIITNNLFSNELMSISSQYNFLQTKVRNGIIAENDYTLQTNKLIDALLKIIDYYELEN